MDDKSKPSTLPCAVSASVSPTSNRGSPRPEDTKRNGVEPTVTRMQIIEHREVQFA